MRKDGYTLRYYMVAYKTNPKADVRVELRRLKDVDPKMMEDLDFFVSYLNIYFPRNKSGRLNSRELPELLQLFKEYPQYLSRDRSRRELLRAYLDAHQIDDAEKCFNEWFYDDGEKMTKQTIELMINRMAKVDLKKAVDIFANAVETNAKYQKLILIKDIGQNKTCISLDLHNKKLSRHGAPRYGADSDNMVLVKLWYLYNTLLHKVAEKSVCGEEQRIDIQIISGQGSQFSMRDFVCRFLEDTFGWQCRPGIGVIHISGDMRSLRQLAVETPKALGMTS
jgi:hypothetical protein